MRALFTAAAVASIGLCAAAHAGTINWSQFTDNATSQTLTVDGKTVMAKGISNVTTDVSGAFLKKSMTSNDGTWWGVGIKGGAVSGEIDGLNPGEAITFDFTGYNPGGVTLGYLEVAFLFKEGQWGDGYNEAAKLIVNNSYTYELAATSTGITGTYQAISGPSVAGATVTNISPALRNQGAGVWRVNDPCSTPVKTLTLVAGGYAGSNAWQSDYAFRELSVVPLPSAVWSGLGLLGAIGVVRMRKQRA